MNDGNKTDTDLIYNDFKEMDNPSKIRFLIMLQSICKLQLKSICELHNL